MGYDGKIPKKCQSPCDMNDARNERLPNEFPGILLHDPLRCVTSIEPTEKSHINSCKEVTMPYYGDRDAPGST